jgi:hypothetical protein
MNAHTLDQLPALLRHVHFSEKYKLVYVDTPKAGCSTIKWTLHCAERGQMLPMNMGSRTNPYGYSDFLLDVHNRSASPLRWPENLTQLHELLASARFTFCFVRNPYTRVLSTFVDKIQTDANRRAHFLNELEVPELDHSRTISFLEFLEAISTQPPHAMNAHWRLQEFHTMQDEITYDFVGAFERFSADLNSILSSIDAQLPHYVTTVAEHKTGCEALVPDYYADVLAQRLVRRIYQADFARFGYSEDVALCLTPPMIHDAA